MKPYLILLVAVGLLPVTGCARSPADRVTDWGVVELAAHTPKHLSLDGKDCALTATPLADGRLAVLIETETDGGGKSAPARLTEHTIFTPDVATTASVGRQLVRFTLKLKTP